MHAIRNLVRIGFGTTAVRWAQLGLRPDVVDVDEQATPRNLFGFKDGTHNLKAEEPTCCDEHVWVQPGDGPDWIDGGTYLVARRIRMHIETWDRTSLDRAGDIIGRTKGDGRARSAATGEFEPSQLRRSTPTARR